MASKVPSDPTLSPEMRRFLNNTADAEDRLTTYIDDQIDANALTLASQSEAETGTDNAKYMSALRVAQAIDAQTLVPVFTKSYTSPDQTITSGGSLALAHGLGAMPSLVQWRLKCGSAEANYSVGDELIVTPDGPASSRGVSVVPDSTNINIRFGSTATAFSTLNKTTGSTATLTNANWSLIVRAWA